MIQDEEGFDTNLHLSISSYNDFSQKNQETNSQFLYIEYQSRMYQLQYYEETEANEIVFRNKVTFGAKKRAIGKRRK